MKRTTKMLSALLAASTIAAAPAMAGSLEKKLKLGAGAEVNAETGVRVADSNLGAGVGVGVGADVSAGASANGRGTAAEAGADMETTGSIRAGANNQGEIVSLIRSNGKAAADLSAVTEIENVEIVRVESAADASAKAIENAISDNQAMIDELRASIDANAALAGKLQAEGVDTESVVAARTSADGSVTIYVQ